MADAPTVPGSYLGQFQNGYYWNGTSWDQGETVPSSAVPPSSMSLNSGAPTAPALPPYQGVPGVGMGSPSPPPIAPAPAPAPVTPTPAPTPMPAPPVQRAPTAGAPANVAAFVAKYGDAAEKISQQTGIPKERILAQAGFESGWNVNAPGNNLFGVKAGGGYKGKSQSLATHEADANGNLVPTTGDFRVYDNPEQSFADWADLIKNKYSGAVNPKLTDAEYAQVLQAGGYGTDPNYAAKLHGAITTTRQALGGVPDGSSVPGGSTTAAAPGAPFVPPAGLARGGLLAQSSSDGAAAQQEAAAAAKQKKTSDDLIKQGQGLLGQAETQAPAFNIPAPAAHRPQAQVVGMPDFMQILAQQRLMQGT